MAQDKLNSLIDVPALTAEAEATGKLLVTLRAQLVDTAKGNIALNEALLASTSSKQFADNVNKVNAGMVQQQAIQKKSIDITDQQRLAEIRLQQQREKNIDQFNKQNSAFALLNKQYQAAIQNAKDIGAAQGTASEAFKKASAEANEFGKKVDGINGKVAGAANGVSSALGKAFSGIRFLANAIPNFGIGTFFLVAGTAVLYLVKQLGVLDLFIPKLSQFVKLQQEANAVRLAAIQANLTGAQNAQAELTSLTQLYKATQNSNLSLSERKKAVDELQRQYPDYFKNLSDEAILAGKATTAYSLLKDQILATAQARAAEDKLASNSSRLLENEFKITEARAQRIKQQKDLNALEKEATQDVSGSEVFYNTRIGLLKDKIAATDKNIYDLATDTSIVNAQNLKLTEQIQKNVEKNGTKVLFDDKSGSKPRGASDNSDLDALKQQAENLKRIAENDKKSFEERYQAARDYYAKLLQISDLQAKKELEDGKNKDSVAKLLKANNIKDEALYQAEITNIQNDELKKREEIVKAAYKENQDDIQAANDKELALLSNNFASVSVVLSDKYAKGLLSEKEYQDAKFQLTKSYNKLVRDEEIQALQNRIDLAMAFGADYTEDQKKLDALVVQNNKEANDVEIKNNEDAGKKLSDQKKNAANELKKLEKQSADIVIDSIKSIADARFDEVKKQIDDQKAAIDTETQNQIDAENRSLDSTKTKQEKINIINAQANDKKAQLDRQARKIDHDKAVFDREIAIAKIIEQTAIAIVSALAEFGIFGTAVSVALGAIGAVQIATILATPLPAYAKGGVTKGGNFIAGELGTELMIDPSGRLGLTPDKATFMSAPAGTTIVPHMETMKILANPEKVQYVGGQQIDLSELVGVNREMLRELKNKPKSRQSDRSYRDWNRTFNNYVN
jgi:hypothetical protein